MAFFPKYILVAVVASLAVYLAAPFALTYLGGDAGSSETEKTTVPVADTRSLASASGQNGASELAPPVDTDSVSDTPVTATEDNSIAAAAPVAPAAESGEMPEVIVENVRGYTPSTDKIRNSGSDVIYWGVVIKDAAYYDRDGKKRDEKLHGGVLVEQIAAKDSSKGEMAICRIWRNGTWAGSYLISTADLIRFEGGRQEVDASDVDNLCMYYSMSASYERRKEELKLKAASANPYFNDLKVKATAYKAHQKRAEELTAKRDAAKGAERTKIIQELTQLKNAEARESSEVQSLTRKYEEWKKAHPSAANADVSSDPLCSGYIRKMNELKPKLTVFGI